MHTGKLLFNFTYVFRNILLSNFLYICKAFCHDLYSSFHRSCRTHLYSSLENNFLKPFFFCTCFNLKFLWNIYRHLKILKTTIVSIEKYSQIHAAKIYTYLFHSILQYIFRGTYKLFFHIPHYNDHHCDRIFRRICLQSHLYANLNQDGVKCLNLLLKFKLFSFYFSLYLLIIYFMSFDSEINALFYTDLSLYIASVGFFMIISL